MKNWIGLAIGFILFLLFVYNINGFNWLFAPFASQPEHAIYQITPFYKLLWNHLYLVGISEIFAIIVGVSVSIIVTRAWGRDFLPIVLNLTSIGQTIPPVAVLALAVPSLGFGSKAVFIALFLYGILPIIRNSITALTEINPELIEAAKGQGMKNNQILFQLELPMAVPAIMAGVRTSTAIMIGTATIASAVSVKSLGEPIVAGLTNFNMAYILEGAIIVGLLAVFIDYFLKNIERDITYLI